MDLSIIIVNWNSKDYLEVCLISISDNSHAIDYEIIVIDVCSFDGCQEMLRERINEVLSTLSPREARIIRLRFGLDCDKPYTLEEVGQKFGLTRERIRQIEGKALRRLRNPRQARLLREYL